MKTVSIIREASANKRIAFGLSQLEKSLEKAGYTLQYFTEEEAVAYRDLPGCKLYVGNRNTSEFLKNLEELELLLYHQPVPEGEGFYLSTVAGGLTVVSGGSDTGALYGCLELAEQIDKEGMIPYELAFGDAPVYKLRGPVLGLQKTKLEPPRRTYEYPITPDRFPWFYDKQHWEEYLEMMVKNRCNVLYIWSGHPFASLVKVPEYPEALEVTEEELQLNHDTFMWLTEECDRRGIWVVLKFYNIHIPYEFATYHGLDPHQSSIHPLVADYTRKSIAEFIKSYPHIGLMVCLGEALRGLEAKTEWFVKTIIPGVKDGIQAAGITEEPPIILRGHDCDPVDAMNQALPLYSNLYTMWKYNGEGLTTYQPRGSWQQKHLELSKLTSNHIINIHIVADLEPFRYGAPSFIQKCMQAAQNRLGGNGLHLYPMFYWDWPYSPDKKEERLLQVRRDWMWYDTWFRYAWNPNRDAKTEQLYWQDQIAQHYGCDMKTAAKMLTAIEAAGQLAPRNLRRIGITEGNRQTWSLGMSLSEMTNVRRYNPNLELWNSVGGKGEQPDAYVQNKIAGKLHVGETPVDMIADTDYYAKLALAAVEEAGAGITVNCDEYEMWKTDIQALALLTDSYNRKLEGALKILEYKYTMDENLHADLSLLEEAKDKIEANLVSYRALAELTDKTYLFAQSMQTPQRKIPFPNGEIFGHWTDCLVEYEKEYANLCKHLEEMKAGQYPSTQAEESEFAPLKAAPYTLLSTEYETYPIKKGEAVFNDTGVKIQNLIPEVSGLTGVRFPHGAAIGGNVKIKVELPQDSKVIIGYMNEKSINWLQVPDLETNTHADDRGGLTPIYKNAMKVQGCPKVNFHMFKYEKGVHEISFDNGGFVFAGVIAADEPVTPRNAEMADESLESLDWLYE
ncbi:MAG: hypothetical protein IJ315_03445 [Firmicutes bacterium]|nr:hypothetical protein [Bacillota bacterium]